MIAAALTFLSGAGYELGCVLWTHHSERGEDVKTALWSMMLAACQVFGIGESVHDMHLAPLFILGYGAGTFIGVRWKERRVMSARVVRILKKIGTTARCVDMIFYGQPGASRNAKKERGPCAVQFWLNSGRTSRDRGRHDGK